MSAPLARQNPFGAALPNCGVCAAYGTPWGAACWRCGVSKGYSRSPERVRAAPRPIPVAAFQRKYPEPVRERPPHPRPQVSNLSYDPLVPHPRVPRQAAELAAVATEHRWRIPRSTYARDNDIDPKTCAALGIMESFALVLRQPGVALLATWRADLPWVCGACATPRKPLPSGLVRKHGECAGGGQPAVAGPPAAEPDWEWMHGGLYSRDEWRKVTGIRMAKTIVKG